MADSPTWMELRGMFLSLKHTQMLRLDLSKHTPTLEGKKAGGFEHEYWRVVAWDAQQRREFEAICQTAGLKLFHILNPLISCPLSFPPPHLEQFWYGMAVKPDREMDCLPPTFDMKGDTAIYSILHATLQEPQRHFATKCLEFHNQWGEGPSPIAEAVPTVAAAMSEQPKAAPTKRTWEALGGPKPSSWNDVIIWFDRHEPLSLTVEVKAKKLSVSMKDLGLGDARYNDEQATKPFAYLTTLIANRSKLNESTKPQLEAKRRQLVNKTLQEFFGLDVVPISAMNEPSFQARDLRTWKEPRRIAQ